jgi:DNA-binding NtrC family response regulator
LIDRVSEHERDTIAAGYYGSTGELDKLIDAYRLGIANYPRWWGFHNNLSNVYIDLGQFEEGLKEGQAAAQLQPNAEPPYRLAMLEVKLPRLADRKEDLPLLQRHFLELFSKRYGKPNLNLTRRAQAIIAGYSWPGNVRELENVLGYCCLMAERGTIDVRDLPEQLQAQGVSRRSEEESLLSLEKVERKHALRVLDQVGGNRVRASEILGIGRATLYRILARSRE